MNGWKITAIIFIILFILETLCFFLLWKAGTEMIERENDCVFNVCGGEDFDEYYYDDLERFCYCYKNHELIHQEYIK